MGDMGDKEILAELKKCYEYLQDIIDNANREQLDSTKGLKMAQEIMARKYEEVYKKAKQENIETLCYKEDIEISPNIYADYIDNDGIRLSNASLDWQKWWEDDDFVNEFNRRMFL